MLSVVGVLVMVWELYLGGSTLALAAHPFLFLYLVVAVLIALGGLTVILIRRGADWRYVIVLTLFGALFVLACWVLITG